MPIISNFPTEDGTTATTTYYGITKLSTDTNSTATNLAATPSAVNEVRKACNLKADQSNPVFTGNISMGRKAGTTVGDASVATGYDVEASGYCSHAEGHNTVASANQAHAEGDYSIASNGYSHAEGLSTEASGQCSHAEGFHTVASASHSHAEGYMAQASGQGAHAEGYETKAIGSPSHAEGRNSEASGDYSHTEGYYSIASGSPSHAEGNSTASGDYSHAEGKCTASGECSHAEGSCTTANNYGSHAGGKNNKEMTGGGGYSTIVGDVMVLGNGTNRSSALSNCFRVTYKGEVYGLSAFNSTGADYAEFFEWADKNPSAEDRVGYFVTLEGAKIRPAKPGEYILGIVSGQPCIIGNADEDWLGRWEHDVFGRFVLEYLENEETEISTEGLSEEEMEALRMEPDVKEKDGTFYRVTAKVVDHKTPSWRHKTNPDYDATQQYVERKDRPEWSAVGMMGVLSVWDDGSCQVNGFCQVAEGGIATAASGYTPGLTYRVIARVSDHVIKVVFR